MGRPARPEEEPAFGSVWQWQGGGACFMAFGLKKRPTGSHVMLLAVRMYESPWGEPAIDTGMTWGYIDDETGLRPTDGWVCVDEGAS